MSDNIIQLNEEIIKTELKDLVRSSLRKLSMPCLIKKQMNLSMLQNMSVRESVKAIDPVIISET